MREEKLNVKDLARALKRSVRWVYEIKAQGAPFDADGLITMSRYETWRRANPRPPFSKLTRRK